MGAMYLFYKRIHLPTQNIRHWKCYNKSPLYYTISTYYI